VIRLPEDFGAGSENPFRAFRTGGNGTSADSGKQVGAAVSATRPLQGRDRGRAGSAILASNPTPFKTGETARQAPEGRSLNAGS